jgi:NAD(P)-dependent dehydrogenase (short-subunit alcohol dehydrogenase family)
MADLKKMNGQRVLVTGSGTGIGREVALEFARRGADVAFHYSHSADGAKSAVEESCKLGTKAKAFQADFTSVQEVQKLGSQVIDYLGGVDILVNNAGITMNKPFLKTTQEQFDKLYSVNIRAQYFLTQVIVKDMLTRSRGAICNITSVHGLAGVPEHSAYAAMKGAIIAYTRSLSIELAHKGIRVNAIAPGCVVVENYSKLQGFTLENQKKWAHDSIPVARHGNPIDIAKLAVFLCSEDASFIIGQTIVSDGGTCAMMSLVSDFRAESEAQFGIGYI